MFLLLCLLVHAMLRGQCEHQNNQDFLLENQTNCIIFCFLSGIKEPNYKGECNLRPVLKLHSTLLACGVRRGASLTGHRSIIEWHRDAQSCTLLLTSADNSEWLIQNVVTLWEEVRVLRNKKKKRKNFNHRQNVKTLLRQKLIGICITKLLAVKQQYLQPHATEILFWLNQL